ncbi:MAG: hypothetical protein ACXVRZ_06260 [Gaiellaceae bacterium]
MVSKRVAAAVLLGGYLVWVRPRLNRVGATAEEARTPLPGDGLVEGARPGSTMGVTIHAPAAAIWPWLVQMGCGRAGWYSHDRLDNAGIPSAEQLLPEYGSLEVGDRMWSVPDGRTWFEVAKLDPGRALVLRHRIDLRAGRSLEPGQPTPRLFTAGTWAFALDERPDGTTRLLVRTATTGAPRVLLSAADALLLGPAHVVMQREQLRNLKRRAERTPAAAG